MKKLLFILFLLLSVPVSGDDGSKGKNNILIISSYNPDTERMSSFINDFEKEISAYSSNYQILIEDMASKRVTDYKMWQTTLSDLLLRYKDKSVHAVILLGQEAFSTYLSLPDSQINTPFFACFASESGIDLFDDSSISIDMVARAREKGDCGGILNKYDVEKNISLILHLYPDTKHIAFLSDNTYGGISLQALVKKEISNFPDLNLICIDSRYTNIQSVPDIIAQLPERSVLLIGTWRVDKNSMYMINNSINPLTAKDQDMPVFTMTGTGMGSIAIGGYVPIYETSGAEIAKQIYDYYNEGGQAKFIIGKGEYRFDREMLDRFAIRDSHLPKGSEVFDRSEVLVKKYKEYAYSALTIIILLIGLIFWFGFLYRRNKFLQRALLTAKEKAEEADRLKSAFLANMGHEIRTPLNSIVGFSNLLSDESFNIEQRQEFIQIISKNSAMLLTLVNDILDISRMEAGRMEFRFSHEEVRSICEQVNYTTKHLHKESVQFKIERNNDSIPLYTDVQRIAQILINLVSNALKFTSSGSVTLSYDLLRDKNIVLFSVTDTGCGIPEEYHSKVFQRFEKINTNMPGTGLGLVISKQLAMRLGGDVWIDTSYKEGCRFLFSHPITHPEATIDEEE